MTVEPGDVRERERRRVRGRGPHGWMVRAVAGTALAGGSWLAVSLPLIQRGDVRVGDAVRRFSTPSLDSVVRHTTDLGSLYAVGGAATALAAAGRRDAAADVLGVGAAAWVLSQTNKRLVRRQRPYEAQGVQRLIRPPTGSSFPSGHAACGVGVMAIAADHVRPGIGPSLLHAVGVYVAASRVYVGVHYPTDVIGGAGLGLLIAALWRGPVAVAGRGGIGAATRTGRRLAPLLLRAVALAALGVRLRRWHDEAPPAEAA